MKELTLQATLENLTQVTDFLEQELEAAGCPQRAHREEPDHTAGNRQQDSEQAFPDLINGEFSVHVEDGVVQ